MERARAIIIGDSHIHAIQSAITENLSTPDAIYFQAWRLKGTKFGKPIGDVTVAKLLDEIKNLRNNDALVLALRGNTYNVVGLMNHPKPFDLEIPGFPNIPEELVEERIPYSVVFAYFLKKITQEYGKLTIDIVGNCQSARKYLLAAPAPKFDNAHIIAGAETYFKDAGITDIGVAHPFLRLKLWEIQQRVLRMYCETYSITFLSNPDNTRDEAGFLKKFYYAKDATHANARYGAEVLQQMAEIMTRHQKS